jgi:hypothetical protein
MISNEPDVAAVRNMPPGLPEPTDASVSRTWYAIGQRQATRKTRRRYRVLMPVTAAAVVLGVVVGGAALLRSAAHNGTAPAGAADQSASKLMASMIDKAAKIPAASPGAHDLVYGVSTGVTTSNDTEKTTSVEWWAAPGQMMPLRRTENGSDVEADVDHTGVDNRNIVRDKGGSYGFPTVQWLAALPAERAALIQYLRGYTAKKPVTDAEVMGYVQAVFGHGEPLVPPRSRVALYQLIADMPDLTAQELTVDGRSVWAVLQGATHTYGQGLLFDAKTGRTVGELDKWIGSPAADRSAVLKTKLPADYSITATWRFAIVNNTKQRP